TRDRHRRPRCRRRRLVRLDEGPPLGLPFPVREAATCPFRRDGVLPVRPAARDRGGGAVAGPRSAPVFSVGIGAGTGGRRGEETELCCERLGRGQDTGRRDGGRGGGGGNERVVDQGRHL
ncbi:hypothetical protein OC842_005081, partial [Tilletia horrida]